MAVLVPKLKRVLTLLFAMLCIVMGVHAQYFQLLDNRKQVTLPFRLIRNLIIIKLNINGKGPFNFILDSGAGLMIITDPTLLDTLGLPGNRTINLAGVGKGKDCQAYLVPGLNVELNNIGSVDVGAAVFKKDQFGLSNYAGIPIHGLLGYEFFNKLVVKIDFNDSTITAFRPGVFRPNKRYCKLLISIHDNKPYLSSTIQFCDYTRRSCRLVVDIGAGHPLSLEHDNVSHWPVDKAIKANLGMGLTGPISGEISRVNCLLLGKYKLNNVLSSFPEVLADAIKITPRDGNIGLDVLKRFTVIFDYADSTLYLKSIGNLKEPFERDMSGLEYYAQGDELKHVIIDRVEPGSAGYAIGLQKDDELVAVNFKPVASMSLEDLDGIFKSKDGRGLILEIFRNKKYENVLMFLKRRI